MRSINGKDRRAVRSRSRAPSRSCTLAGWTVTLRRRPSVSTRMWRLRPVIFLPASKPCGSSAEPACMARPYSRDLRERVVRSVEAGLSRRQAAEVFGVGIATVIEWVRVWREAGRLEAKAMGGDRNSRLREERGWLLERIAAVP